MLRQPSETAHSADSADNEEAVLRQRARVLAQTTTDSAPVQTVELLKFRLAAERYAIPMEVLREVMDRPVLTPVPGTPSWLAGITNLRGEVLAVLDLRQFLGLSHDRTDCAWVMVCGGDRAEFGIAADGVDEVTQVSVQDILPSDLRAGDVAAGMVRGMTRDAITVLDGAAILNDHRLFVDDARPAAVVA